MLDLGFFGSLLEAGVGARSSYLAGDRVGQEAARKRREEEAERAAEQRRQEQMDVIRELQRQQAELNLKQDQAPKPPKEEPMLQGRHNRMFPNTAEGREQLKAWEEETRPKSEPREPDPLVVQEREARIEDRRTKTLTERARGYALRAATVEKKTAQAIDDGLRKFYPHLDFGARSALVAEAKSAQAAQTYAGKRDERADASANKPDATSALLEALGETRDPSEQPPTRGGRPFGRHPAVAQPATTSAKTGEPSVDRGAAVRARLEEQRRDYDRAATALRQQGKDPVSVLGKRP